MSLFIKGIDSVSEVLEIRARAIEALKAGSEVVQWASEGTSVTKVISMKASEVIKECNDFLKEVDPETYGGRRVRRTLPYYRS